MRGHQFGADDTAVSEVLGVALMVALTVLLAATVGSFMLGLGQEATQNQGPTVAWQFDYSASGSDTVTVLHNGGDGVDPAQVDLVVIGAESTDASDSPNGQYNLVDDFGVTGDEFSAGMGVTFDGAIAGVDGGDDLDLRAVTMRMVWESPDGSNSVTMAAWQAPGAD
jgi:FlaG/FlaF family flagellin (archaellin)